MWPTERITITGGGCRHRKRPIIVGRVMESDQLQKGIRERDQLQRWGHGKRPTTEDDMERDQLQRELFF